MTERHDDGGDAAGEYVLGTLDRGEHARFAGRLGSDPAARAAVEAWRVWLEPLLLAGTEVVPSDAVWRRIEARIGARPANDDRVSPMWRGIALAASLLAIVGGVAALRPVAMPAPVVAAPLSPTYVAAVTAGGAQPALIVTIDSRSGTALVRAIALTPPAAKALELWYIGEGRTPRSLGFVSGDVRLAMPMARGDRLDGGLFAVTAEPAAKPPGGSPTGEILYSGKPMQVAGT